jgi:hypothetical protein
VTGFAQKSITLSHRRVAGGYTVAGKSTLDSGSETRGLTNSWLCTEVASKLGTYKHVKELEKVNLPRQSPPKSRTLKFTRPTTVPVAQFLEHRPIRNVSTEMTSGGLLALGSHAVFIASGPHSKPCILFLRKST